MSDQNEPIECERHGAAITTFTCIHLGPNTSGLGFNLSPEDPDDRWPDATCDACAARDEALTADEIRILCHRCYEYARARNVHLRKPDDFLAFIDASEEELRAKQERTFAEFKINDHPRWDWNQESGQIVFSRDGKPQVIARIQFVGSISTTSDTWLWSWANDSYEEHVKSAVSRLRAYGADRGWDALVEQMWTAEEVDGWEMTALAARVLGAKGAYRTPSKTGFTFMLLMDVAWAT